MQNYERIRKVIQDSLLDNKDKLAMYDVFADISDENLGNIADLFEKKPASVSKFNENRIKKQEAFKSGDSTLLREILDEEKKYIDELVFGLD